MEFTVQIKKSGLVSSSLPSFPIYQFFCAKISLFKRIIVSNYLTILEDLLFQDNSFFVCHSLILAATSGFHYSTYFLRPSLLLAGLRREKENCCQLLSPRSIFDCSLKSFYSLPVDLKYQ